MSRTYIANFVTLLTLVIPLFGWHITNPDNLTNAILAVVGVISTLYVFYGRYKAGGISAFGFKKDETVLQG